jgi:hypothetical protein
LVVVVAEAEPLKVIVTPDNAPPPLAVTVPERVYVAAAVAVKFWPVTLAPLTVTFRLVGLKT